MNKDTPLYLLKFFLGLPILGAVIGGCFGGIAFFILKLIPWVDKSRHEMIIPLFVVGGGILGIYQGVQYFKIFQKIDRDSVE